MIDNSDRGESSRAKTCNTIGEPRRRPTDARQSHETQLKLKMLTTTTTTTTRLTAREKRLQARAAVALLALSLAAVDLICTTGAQEAPKRLDTNNANATAKNRTRIMLPAECASRATCAHQAAESSRLLDFHKRTVPLCRCDEHCRRFDDCCQDASGAETPERRLELGAGELRRRRREFQCRMVSASAGHLLVKAKCNADWLRAQQDRVFAEHTRQKCELTLRNEPAAPSMAPADSDVPPLPDDWIQADPMGSMIPITDKLTGITYLNSHCVRCNLHEDNIDRIATAKQLIYWTPLVKCNYDPELGDDRNKLYELLAAKRGDALKYSQKHRRWYINMEALKRSSSASANETATATATATTPSPSPSPSPSPTTTTTSSPLEPEVGSRLSAGAETDALEEELEQQKRSCSIIPTLPKQAERLMRRCVPNLIDECLLPALPSDCELMRQARVDCIYKSQALVYSFNSSAVYHNLGCARCNRERLIHCRPPRRRRPAPAAVTLQLGPQLLAASFNANAPTGRKLDEISLAPKSELSAPPASSEFAESESLELSNSLSSSSSSSNSNAGEEAGLETGPFDEAGSSEPADSLDSMSRATSSGSFAVLFDMEPLRHSDAAGAADVVGQAKRCFGNQYFDFFENKCRCAICGIWKRYINGACVPIPEQQREGSNLTPAPAAAALSSSAAGASETPAPTRPAGQLTQNAKRDVTASSEFALVNETHLESAAEAAADKRAPPTTSMPMPALSSSARETTTTSARQQLPQGQRQNQKQADSRDETGHSKSGQQARLVVGSAANASANDAAEQPPVLSDERIFRHFEQLPVATYEARWAYSGCAKTNVPPTNYRLFNITELIRYQNLNSISSPSAGAAQQVNSGNERVSESAELAGQRPDFHLRKLRPHELELVWAYVAPWNVTLPPGKYELRRTGLTSAEGQHEEMELYICIPIMPRGEDKFDRHMVWLTTLGLMVSIASLLCYLALYFLSSLDLRHLVVQMSKAGQASDSLQDAALSRKYRQSCASAAGGAGRSRSLSSRGVACLAGSLLAAYIFFMLGNQLQYTPDEAAALQLMQEARESERQGLLTNCKLIAAATVCAFLMAFNWMFLLSFDIWRILRLATYQLRGPSSGSQSMRFFIYATLATFSALLVTLVALSVDQWDPWIRCGAGAPEELLSAATWCPLNVAEHRNEFDRFVHRYKPYFGHQPGSCWFVNRRALGLFFGLPVALIITANLLFFLHSSYMVLRTSSRSKLASGKQKQQQLQTRTLTSNCNFESTLSPAPPRTPPANTLQTVTLLDNDQRPQLHLSKQQQQQQQQQQEDFAQQNALTTSSLSSVRTMQSAMSAELSAGSRRSSASGASSNGAELDGLAPEAISRLAASNADGASPAQAKAKQVAESQESQETATDSQKHLVIDLEEACELYRQMEQIAEIEKRREAFRQEKAGKQKSSISLASHQSNNSLGSNLAQRYDTSKSNLSALMSSMGKDYRLYCRLSTIMGLTWITGLLASLVDHSETLWYVFVLLNTLQGLFIFIAFGFKRSRLTNLEILANYAAFKMRNWTRRPDRL